MIETERLFLRPYELADYEPYCLMVCDPTTNRFPGRQPVSREEAWHRVMRYAGHWALLGYGMFAVIERASGRYIGETGLGDFHRGMGADFDGSAEASWYLVAHSHGRGFGLEAAQAVHAWYHRQSGQSRTVCMIDPENRPSLALAAKLGYGIFRESDYKGNRVVMLERVTA